MKRKTIALVLILAITTIILTGCSSMPRYEEENKDDKTFMTVEDYLPSGRVLVDKETNVMYWQACGGRAYGILTLLVDKDGKPKIWNGGK